MMKPLRLHHVQLTVPTGAEAEARRFYCGTLGLAEIPKPNALASRGGFWLRLGDVEIHVGTEDGFDRRRTKAHLAYEVEDLDCWRDRLGQAGAVILNSVPLPGYDRFKLRDPFGNRLELIERK